MMSWLLPETDRRKDWHTRHRNANGRWRERDDGNDKIAFPALYRLMSVFFAKWSRTGGSAYLTLGYAGPSLRF